MEGDFGRFVGNVLRVKSKRGRPPVLSAQAFYPMREERELQALLRGELLRSWTASVAEQLERFSDEDASEPFGDGFMEKVWKIADAIIVNAQQSLVKFSEMTIGVPYYPPAVSESVKKDWVDTFQKLCISADTQGKADIATAIYTAKSEGKNKYQVEHEVEQFLPAKTRHRAELIARTETGKLNNAATMATYESAGIRYYRWLATTDERTRPTHAAMNDLICAVGDPDHYYEETPEGLEKKVRTAGMYHGDPGTDFQCRCTSVPWDPRIDGKYDVKEVPEPPEKAPSKLEQARAETAKAEERAEEAERKLRLMTAANERHAKRTPEQRAEIQARWDERREILCALPKATWDLAKKIGNDYVNAIKEQLKKRPKNYIKASRLLDNTIDDISKDETYFTRFDNKISIYMKCAKTNPRGQGTTMLHEQGHALDFAIGKACGYKGYISETMDFGKSVSKALRSSLLKEADDFIKEYEKTNPFPAWFSKERKQNAYIGTKFLEGYSSLPIPDKMIFGKITICKNANNKIDYYHEHEASAISDIIHGVLKGRLSLGYGHSKSYWNSKTIGAESFTHFGTLIESEFGRKFLQTYLSGPLKEWEDMIKLGADKAPDVDESLKKH